MGDVLRPERGRHTAGTVSILRRTFSLRLSFMMIVFLKSYSCLSLIALACPATYTFAPVVWAIVTWSGPAYVRSDNGNHDSFATQTEVMRLEPNTIVRGQEHRDTAVQAH